MQTAQQISKGYGNINIEESTLLGNPGIFVNDGDKAMNIFTKYELLDIINIQLSKQTLNGFNKIDIATQYLLHFIKDQDDNILYISHDAIITPFISCIFGYKKIKQNDIVTYLNGYSYNKKHPTKTWKKINY